MFLPGQRGAILQVANPRLNRVDRCSSFETSCLSDSHHQGSIAQPSALAVVEFLCHLAISASFAFGPKEAAKTRTYNAFLPGCDRRFVINNRKLMIVDCQQQTVIDGLVKVIAFACAIALRRGENAFDNLQPMKECFSSGRAIETVGCKFLFNERFCLLP